MINKIDRNEVRSRKHLRVRKHIHGTPERPRLCVFRSHAQIYAQIIDDTKGTTLVAASSLEGEVRGDLKYCGNITAAKAVGTAIAKRALANNITTVVFDRGGYLYHGRVAAVAEAAREAGLKF